MNHWHEIAPQVLTPKVSLEEDVCSDVGNELCVRKHRGTAGECACISVCRRLRAPRSQMCRACVPPQTWKSVYQRSASISPSSRRRSMTNPSESAERWGEWGTREGKMNRCPSCCGPERARAVAVSQPSNGVVPCSWQASASTDRYAHEFAGALLHRRQFHVTLELKETESVYGGVLKAPAATIRCTCRNSSLPSST